MGCKVGVAVRVGVQVTVAVGVYVRVAVEVGVAGPPLSWITDSFLAHSAG